MFSKKTVTIETDDGVKKDVEISVDDSGKFFAVWGTDEEIQKAFAQYLLEKKKVS